MPGHNRHLVALTPIDGKPILTYTLIGRTRTGVERRSAVSDIFISYSRRDHTRAKSLAQALTDHGISVWWDNLLSPGDFVGKVLTERINAAKAVVVLWTSESIHSQWV